VKPVLLEYPVRPVSQVKLVKKALRVLLDLKESLDLLVLPVYLDSLVNVV